MNTYQLLENHRLWSQLDHGDELVVWKLDRLGRSTAHLVRLLDELGQRGVQFRSLTEPAIDTTTAQGRLLTSVMAAMAQFERDLIRERTAAGLAAARTHGARLGRPCTITAHQVEMITHYRTQGMTQAQIGDALRIPRTTIGRILRKEIIGLPAPTHTLVSEAGHGR
ncbi:recombinase family protein [Cutibacterium namnetense]|uniref:recombinase family protein n=1 Tax=Cutibacterium namnetense TaxID=1574624 RepID=UPI000D54D638